MGLLAAAPARIFPRARRLYFDKYPLEGHPASLDAAATPGPFRTFVLSERPGDAEPGEEAAATSPASGVESLAIVQWQATRLNVEAATAYLAEQWQVQAVALQPMPQSWFRGGGAWARVNLSATDPAPAEAPP